MYIIGRRHTSAPSPIVAISPSPSGPMDDEETIWKLDATALSGFAIQDSGSEETGAGEEVRFISHSIEDVDVTVSQTLETHHFPYYLQILLAPRQHLEPLATSSVIVSSASSTVSASTSTSSSSSAAAAAASGVILLLPLNHILSVLISDHSHYGQTLRIKLTDANKRTERIRQSISTTGPGRMFGVNEPDPFDVLGMLKFREMSVKIAGVNTAWRQAVVEWTECMRRNAEKEWGHWFQILRENRDGIWEILEPSDGGNIGVNGEEGIASGMGRLDGKEKDGKMELDDEDGEDGEMLRIPSVNVSEGTLVSDYPASEAGQDLTRRPSDYNQKSPKTLHPPFDRKEFTSRHPQSDLDTDTRRADLSPRPPRDRSETPRSEDKISLDSGERRQRNSDETSPERYSSETTRYATRPQVKENIPDYNTRLDSDHRPKFLTGSNRVPNHHCVDNRISPPLPPYFQNGPRRYKPTTTRSPPPFRRHYNNYKPYHSSPPSDRYSNHYFSKRFSDPPPFNRSNDQYKSYSSPPPRKRFEHFKPYFPHRRPDYEPRFNDRAKRDDGRRHFDTRKAFYDRRRDEDTKQYDDKKRSHEENRRERSRSSGEEVLVFPPRKENLSKKRIPQIERRE